MKSHFNLLGRHYPFFLNNSNLAQQSYLYQIYSPGLNEQYEPLISLTKVSERISDIKFSPYNQDIISVILDSKAGQDACAEYLRTLLSKEEGVESIEPSGDRRGFPTAVIQHTNSLIKSMIISLRDALRWKNYKFWDGYYVDLLWTPDEFVVFQIKSDETKTWLEPVGVYKNTDTGMINPLNVDLSTIKGPSWEKKSQRASEVNRLFKNIEWESFSRPRFVA